MGRKNCTGHGSEKVKMLKWDMLSKERKDLDYTFSFKPIGNSEQHESQTAKSGCWQLFILK